MNLKELIEIKNFERSDADRWGVLVEELTIGLLGKRNMKVSIYAESFRNPSFHFSSNDFEAVFQIRDFKVLEIKFGNVQDIQGKNFKELLNWFEKPSNDPDITNWQKMINAWNLTNPRQMIDKNLQMPL
jgi:hypothetical protein